MEQKKKDNYKYYLLYGVLTLMMATWTSTDAPPPIYLRLPFLVALVLPLFTKKSSWLPAVLILFMGLLYNGFALTYLPILNLFYYGLIILALMVNKKASHLKEQPVILLLLIYTFIVNLVTGGANETMYLPLFLIFTFAFFIPENEIDWQRHLLSYSFIVISLVQSALYLTLGSRFLVETTYGGIERYYWNDPNYWGGVVAMGAIAAIIELYTVRKRNIVHTLFLLLSIVLPVITCVINASRGAILSLAIGSVCLLLFSGASKSIKFVSTIGAILLVYLIYNSGYVELLLYRFSDESNISEGAGRLSIWESKLRYYWEGGVFNSIFGYGNLGGQNIGGRLAGFHNDYLAFLVEYGIVGFLLFVGWIISIIKKMHNNKLVICLLLFFFSLIFTIEPLTHGLLTYIAFMFYIYVWSRSSELNNLR